MPQRLRSQDPDFETAFASFLSLKREVSGDVDIAVREIIERVRSDGDRALVEADLGLAFLPRVTVANEIRLGLFREIRVNGLQLVRQNLMIYRKNVEPIEIVAAFREFIKNRKWN